MHDTANPEQASRSSRAKPRAISVVSRTRNRGRGATELGTVMLGISTARWCVPVVVVLSMLGLTTPAGAAVTYVWSAPTRIAASGLTGVACPSAALCVAVDQGGEVLVSSDPISGSWKRDRRLGASAFAGVACPTTARCVAVDRAGNIVSSDNPLGGPSHWAVVHVSGYPLSQVSCPTIGLCAVTQSVGPFTSDQQFRDYGDVLVSHSPDIGSSWITEHADDENGPECGKNAPSLDGCYQRFSGLACPTVSLCVAADTSGRMVWSGDPGAATANWSSSPVGPGPDRFGGVGAIGLPSLACPTRSLCVGLCAVENAFSSGTCDDAVGNDLVGIALTWNPAGLLRGDDGSLTKTTAFHTTVSQPSGVWCASSTPCFIGTPNGDLVMSQNPTGGPRTWTVTRRGYVNEPITGISCSRTFCVAVDGAGHAISGIPVNRSEVRKALHRVCVASANGQRLPALARRDGYKMSFAAPSAGRLTIAWWTHAASTDGRVAAAGRPVALARGSWAFKRPGRQTIKLTLTPAGRRIITRARRLGVRVVAKFMPAGNTAITTTGTTELRR